MRRPFLLVLLLLVMVVAFASGVPDTLARRMSGFDQLDLLVDVRHELVAHYVEKPDEQAMVRAAIDGMIESLDDPFTTFLDREDLKAFDRQVRGSFSGIGAEVTIDPQVERIKIVTPLEDSPAWQAGVLAGDIVLEIDGESTEGMSLPEAVERLTGEKGTDVTIRVRHESGELETITITRDRIEITTVRGFRRDADQHWDFWIDSKRRLGYVRLTQFNERTAEELREALEGLVDLEPPLEGLILDLRFNPGGLLDAAIGVSDLFLEAEDEVVSVRGRNVEEQVYRARSAPRVPADVPVVVLANEASASASEIVAGALKENGRGQLVGTRTYGKGSVQQVRMLESGLGAMKITNAYYYIPGGRNLHRREDAEVWGVDPDPGYYVPMSPEAMRAMIEVRREGEILRPDRAGAAAAEVPEPVDPDWIASELKDPQLAAAVRTLRHRIETGDWLEVGGDQVEALVRRGRRESLAQRRDLLRQRLEEVEEELAGLEAAGAGDSGDEAAEDGGDAAEGAAGEMADEPAEARPGSPETAPATQPAEEPVP